MAEQMLSRYKMFNKNQKDGGKAKITTKLRSLLRRVASAAAVQLTCGAAAGQAGECAVLSLLLV